MKQIFLMLSAVLLFNHGGAKVQPNVLFTILDKNAQSITQTVDGNSIQFKLTLPSSVSQKKEVSFYLDDTQIADCSIVENSDSCTTASFVTLGWFWHTDSSPRPLASLRAEADGKTLAESKLIIQPRPIVLVHGMISDRNRFNSYIGENGYLAGIGLIGYVVGDEQFAGVMKMGNIINPAEETFTIAENAIELDTYIEGVKQATGAQQVDLLAHSMGGLVTRYYIDRLMTERDVAQLIMLGTPNGGSPCGGALSSLGFWIPATLELQPSYINEIFNKQITNARGVPFYGVAGAIITDPSVSPCSPVPSDSTVSLASVQAIPVDVVGLPKLEHNFLPADAGLFKNFVKPLLQTSAGNFATTSSSQAVSTTVPLQFTQVYTGHINSGESVITINIDPNVAVASFGLFDTTRSLDISVQGASGKILDIDLENNGIIINDPETLLYLGYGFEDPKPGAWVVTLRSTEKTPSIGADYALYAKFIGGAKLNANIDVLLPELGQSVNISSALEGAQIESSQIIITLPDGAKETVELTANENKFIGEFTPTQPGLHGIEVVVIGKTQDGFAVDRAAFLSIEAQPERQSSVITWVWFVGIFGLLMLPLGLFVRFVLKRRKTK